MAKAATCFEFRAAERAAGGVLRMAEDQHACARIRRGLVGGEVEHPARAVVAHRIGDQAAASVVDRGHERRIGRQLQQHRVTRVAECHHRGEAGLHQIADGVCIGRIGLPTEAVLHAAGERRGQCALARGVAVFLAAGEPGQRVGDGGSDAKVHVGDPGGQHVVGKFVPLVGAAGAQRRDVEVGRSGGHTVFSSFAPADIELGDIAPGDIALGGGRSEPGCCFCRGGVRNRSPYRLCRGRITQRRPHHVCPVCASKPQLYSC